MGYEEALAAFRRGDDAEAARLAQLDLDGAAAAGDASCHVDALCMLARVALRAGRVDEVAARAVAAQGVAAQAGERRLLRMPIHLRAVAARMAGAYSEARELYRESISLNDQLGEALMAAVEHRNLAWPSSGRRWVGSKQSVHALEDRILRRERKVSGDGDSRDPAVRLVVLPAEPMACSHTPGPQHWRSSCRRRSPPASIRGSRGSGRTGPPRPG